MTDVKMHLSVFHRCTCLFRCKYNHGDRCSDVYAAMCGASWIVQVG